MNATAIKQVGRFLRKNSNYICSGIAMVGTVATAVFAAKGAVKAQYIIDEIESQREEPMEFKEKVQATWKCYIPAVACGTVTIASAGGAEWINVRRYSDLGTLYCLDKVAHNEYVEKVKEQLGVNKEEKLRDEINKELVEKSGPYHADQFINTGGNIPFIDTYFGTKFFSTYENVERAEMAFVSYISKNGYAAVNDWHEMLNLPSYGVGDDVGWDAQCMDISETTKLIRFTTTEIDVNGVRTPCAAIEYNIKPECNFGLFEI